MPDSCLPAVVPLSEHRLLLYSGKDRQLLCKMLAGEGEAVSPEARSLQSLALCQERGVLHALLFTADAQLVYARTRDGIKWTRHLLSVLDSPALQLVTPLIACYQGLHVCYLLCTAQGSALIHYSYDPAGGWRGRRIASFPSGQPVRLTHLMGERGNLYLFLQGVGPDRATVQRLTLVDPPPAPQDFLSVPLPFEDFQVTAGPDGQLHSGYLCQGQPFVDGAPLSLEGGCSRLCLSLREDALLCQYLQEGIPRAMELRPQGFSPSAPPPAPTGEIGYWVGENGITRLFAGIPLPTQAAPPSPQSQTWERLAAQLREQEQRLSSLDGQIRSLRTALAALEQRLDCMTPSP